MAEVIQGDCVVLMASMDENSVDAVVCDPPYHLSFMGKKWDHSPSPRESQATHEVWAREALRVLKPGGFLVAAGGTRTFHRLVCAIEDAGFEIRDTIMHVYGSGFPKSANIGKHIGKLYDQNRRAHGLIPTNGTETMQRYNGHGTALKPSQEPWTLARKPLSHSSVARNVLKHGTGAINVDGCRVGKDTSRGDRYNGKAPAGGGASSFQIPHEEKWNVPAGRFPPNLLLSHVPPDANGEGGCQPTGERRRVKGSRKNVPYADGDTTPNGIYGEYDGRSNTQHTDPDGYEEVEGWECVPNCPILLMDEQSGQLKSGGGDKGNKTIGAQGYGSNSKEFSHSYEANKGGASRFYPRFVVDDADSFLYDNSQWADRTHGDTSVRQTSDGTESGASPEAEKSTPSLKAAGCGSENTEKSQKATKSTTSTTTRQTTDSKTSHSLSPDGTTATTSDSEKTIKSSTAQNTGAANGAENTSPSQDSSAAGQEPSKDTVSPVWSSTPENGASKTKNECANSGETTTTARNNETPRPRFFPNFAGATGAGFLYQAKASRRERNAGLEGMPERPAEFGTGGNKRLNDPAAKEARGRTAVVTPPSANSHPTVKPLALMDWLITLITPPGGTVLDPFAGSGSTGCSAVRLGFDFIGIEKEEEYAEIARKRIEYWSQSEAEAIPEVSLF